MKPSYQISRNVIGKIAILLIVSLSMASIQGAGTHGKDPTGTSDPSNIDSDDDGLPDTEDAVPDDPEINWLKSSESRYVWIEQMTTPQNDNQRLIPPVAVNSSGLILFPYYTVGEWDPGTETKKNHLWDSAKRQWADLPHTGSQGFEIEGGPTFTATDQAGGFIDINDAGTVSAFGRGNQQSPPSPTVGAHRINTQPAMIWEKTGTSSAYGLPKYFIYHGAHPESYCNSRLDLSNWTHGGTPYHWSSWRAPGGRIGMDGSMNLCAHIGNSSVSPVWLMRDGTSSSRLLDQTIKQLGDNQVSYLSQVNYSGTFPGAILDKNHALFVETLRDTNTSNVWLKDGEDVTTIASVTPPLDNYDNHDTDMIFAPSTKDDNTERLWIAAGNKILLEKRAGGAGAGRWHNPPSMAEGAIRLNARGEAITPGKPAAAAPTRPKLWRNGLYIDLNEVATKPDTVTITKAIDLASNGIILAQATENGVAKTGLLLPVELRGYATGERNSLSSEANEKYRHLIPDPADYTGFKTEPKTELKIVQWGDGDIFDANNNGAFDHAKFKEDVDIFRIRLPDIAPPAGTAEHRIKIWTVDAAGATLDQGAEVDLNVFDDFHETAALGLVADDETDDIFAVEGKADGALGDRTYRAKLGGKLKFQWLTCPGTGEKPIFEIPIRVKKIVTAKGFLLKGTTDAATATYWFERAKKIYSAIGVDLQYSLQTIDPLPAGVNLNDGFDIPEEITGYLHEMMPETIALMGDPGCQVTPGTIPVFFVKELNPAAQGVTNTPSYMAPGDEKYGGAIFIDSNHDQESVLAHELAHVLLDAQHDPSSNALWNDYFLSYDRHRTNIWFGKQSMLNIWSETGISAHRRLADTMRSRIWKSPYAKNP